MVSTSPSIAPLQTPVLFIANDWKKSSLGVSVLNRSGIHVDYFPSEASSEGNARGLYSTTTCLKNAALVVLGTHMLVIYYDVNMTFNMQSSTFEERRFAKYSYISFRARLTWGYSFLPQKRVGKISSSTLQCNILQAIMTFLLYITEFHGRMLAVLCHA